MLYGKCIVAGALAVLTAGAGVIGMFALLASAMGGEVRTGASLSWQTGTTAAMIFALGFVWQFRRTTRPPRNSKANPTKTDSAAR